MEYRSIVPFNMKKSSFEIHQNKSHTDIVHDSDISASASSVRFQRLTRTTSIVDFIRLFLGEQPRWLSSTPPPQVLPPLPCVRRAPQGPTAARAVRSSCLCVRAHALLSYTVPTRAGKKGLRCRTCSIRMDLQYEA